MPPRSSGIPPSSPDLTAEYYHYYWIRGVGRITQRGKNFTREVLTGTPNDTALRGEVRLIRACWHHQGELRIFKAWWRPLGDLEHQRLEESNLPHALIWMIRQHCTLRNFWRAPTPQQYAVQYIVALSDWIQLYLSRRLQLHLLHYLRTAQFLFYFSTVF